LLTGGTEEEFETYKLVKLGFDIKEKQEISDKARGGRLNSPHDAKKKEEGRWTKKKETKKKNGMELRNVGKARERKKGRTDKKKVLR